MARIAGVTVPTDKKSVHALTYIYGIGPSKAKLILDQAGVDPEARVKDLTETELNRIREELAANHTVEGELQRIVTGNVKRLKDINSYRGIRHKLNLPSKGQRTRTNARTRRGRRQTVGGLTIKAAAKT
ncbi:MAG TPA: 30S ribosomal protein S13 [Candidatus Saccharimonadales bacterium]